MRQKIAVTGYRGRVGKVFLKNPNVFPLDCDIRFPESIRLAIRITRPDLVVHLASRSDVDYCEDKNNEQDVQEMNVEGTFHLAMETERYGCGMVFISSDHVFPGGRWKIFGGYTEKSTPKPKNFYGLTKMIGEGFNRVFQDYKVVRTSTLFDDARIAVERGKMGRDAYPDFLKRSFLYLPHFCKLLYEFCERFDSMPDLLNLAGAESVSYYQFMLDVRKAYGADFPVRPRRDELEKSLAPRGHNLTLNTSLSAELGFRQYSYLDGLQELE